MLVCDWKVPVFDWTVPVCDWKVPVFDWKVPVFDWKVPVFDWKVPVFDWKVPMFDWKAPVFVGEVPTPGGVDKPLAPGRLGRGRGALPARLVGARYQPAEKCRRARAPVFDEEAPACGARV